MMGKSFDLPLNAVDEDLITNNTKRIPVCICIEKSIYTKARIDEFLNSMNKLKKTIMDDPHTLYSVEICLIVFSDKAKIYHPFALFRNDRERVFTGFDEQFSGAENITKPDLCGALELAVKQIRLRKKDYHLAGKSDCYQSTLILIGSGNISRDISRIAETLREFKQSLAVLPICIADKDRSWENYKCLRGDGKVFKGSENLAGIFDSVGSSMANLSASSVEVFNGLAASAKDWDDFK